MYYKRSLRDHHEGMAVIIVTHENPLYLSDKDNC